MATGRENVCYDNIRLRLITSLISECPLFKCDIVNHVKIKTYGASTLYSRPQSFPNQLPLWIWSVSVWFCQLFHRSCLFVMMWGSQNIDSWVLLVFMDHICGICMVFSYSLGEISRFCGQVSETWIVSFVCGWPHKLLRHIGSGLMLFHSTWRQYLKYELWFIQSRNMVLLGSF